MIDVSSSPNSPPSPPCGFSAQTPIRGWRESSEETVFLAARPRPVGFASVKTPDAFIGCISRDMNWSASRAFTRIASSLNSPKTSRNAVCSVTWTTASPAGGKQVLARARVEHHGVVVDAADVGQQFGVAGILVPGAVQRFLVQRGGGDGVHLAVQSQAVAADHGIVGRLAGPGVELPRPHAQRLVGPAGNARNHVRRGLGLLGRFDLDHLHFRSATGPPPGG